VASTEETMLDEQYLKQLNRFLAARRRDAKRESQDAVNEDLQKVEGAFREMRMAEIRKNFATGEIKRLRDTLEEYETSLKVHEDDLGKWRITFEANLSAQKIDLASRMRGLMLRHQEVAAMPTNTDADKEAIQNESFQIGSQMSELKAKLERLKSLLHFKSTAPVVIKTYPPEDMEEFDLPKIGYMDKMICANLKCGRVKIDRGHPLCRNCQRLYKEGKIGGEWTGIVAAYEADQLTQE